MKKLFSMILAIALALSMTACAASSQNVVTSTAQTETGLLNVQGKLVILHTNDTHGRALNDASEPSFGYARIAACKEAFEDAGASVLLLSAGDETQGAPLVNLSQGKAAIEFMNSAGYDAMVPGNHEFDWGMDNFLKNVEDAQFKVVCANITRKSDGETVLAPNTVFQMENGMKVGVFGLDTPKTLTSSNPSGIVGYDFAKGQELYDCAQTQVDELKAAGCDLIVCISHLGVESGDEPDRSTDVADHVNGIDLMLDGHSHVEMGETVNGTLISSTGCYGHNLGQVIYDGTSLDAELIPAVDEDADTATLINGVNDEVQEQLGEVFAKTLVDLNGERDPGVRTEETNLGDYVCDAVLWKAQQTQSETIDASIMNGGSIRASISTGDITMNDLKTVFPFDNTISILSVKGSELLEALEAATSEVPNAQGAFPQVSGIIFTIDTSTPFEQGEQYPDSTCYAPANPGARVTIKSVGGKAFDLDEIYTIATNNFLAAGGDTYYSFKYAFKTSGYDTGFALENALEEYTANQLGGVIGEEYAQPQDRITIK